MVEMAIWAQFAWNGLDKLKLKSNELAYSC